MDQGLGNNTLNQRHIRNNKVRGEVAPPLHEVFSSSSSATSSGLVHASLAGSVGPKNFDALPHKLTQRELEENTVEARMQAITGQKENGCGCGLVRFYNDVLRSTTDEERRKGIASSIVQEHCHNNTAGGNSGSCTGWFGYGQSGTSFDDSRCDSMCREHFIGACSKRLIRMSRWLSAPCVVTDCLLARMTHCAQMMCQGLAQLKK